MKFLLLKLSVILPAIALFAAYGFGQASLPFADGETLTYEGKVSKIIRGIAVADLTFTVQKTPTGADYRIKAEAKSKGTLLRLFRYSFSQEVESTIAANDFRILKTEKHDVQKDRVRDSEAVFDYSLKRVTYVEVDPREPMRPPRKIASEIDGRTHDLISAVYSLRTRPLVVGSSFRLAISDSGLVYDIPVKVTAREQQKSIFGRVWCFRVEPDIFGPNRLIEKEGSMVIWITDDARKLPIRSVVDAPVGKIDIRLKSASKLK